MSQQILIEHIFGSQDGYCYFTGGKEKNIYVYIHMYVYIRIYIYMDICSFCPPVREESYIQRALYEVEWGACPRVLWQFKKGYNPRNHIKNGS